MFGDLGAAIVDADEATHAVYAPGTRGFDAIVQEFGREYVRQGQIDRKRLGDLVFRDDGARLRLNAIVHPLVRDWMAERTVEAAEHGEDVVMHDVPLIFENQLQGLFDATVLVFAKPSTQLERLGARGVPRDRAQGMLAAQMPIDDKRKLADFVIDNEGLLEDTRRQVVEVWTRVRSL